MRANYSLLSLQAGINVFTTRRHVLTQKKNPAVFVSTDEKVRTVFLKVFMIRQVFGLRLQPKCFFTWAQMFKIDYFYTIGNSFSLRPWA